MSESRKLSAILAADVVGFSRLTGVDEDRTLARLRALRSDVIDPTISVHKGRVVKRTGDGVLVEFRSVVDAVRCAIEIQSAMVERNAGLPEDRRIELRIGIHLGDVVEESDGDLMGEGVNIAARLEGIAQPGTICLSEDAYRQVRSRLDMAISDLGETSLKNIVEPVRIYALQVGAAAPPAKPPAQPRAAAQAAAVGERPTVAVLPVRVISGDDEVKALAEGLTDAIGDAIGHQTALSLTSGDPAGADFVLKGSVQAAGKRLRLSFGLEDGASATQVWMQRYDRQLDDIFGLQDEIVLHVAAAIRIKVKAQIFERLRDADNATLAVPQLLDKSAGIFVRCLDLGGEAVSTTRLAVERAPENSMARAMLGYALYRVADHSAAAMPGTTRDEIVATVDRAIVLDPNSYFARAIKALALQDLLGDARGAREQASEGLRHNANFIPAKGMLGIAEIHLGNIADGMDVLREAMEASPDDANRFRHRRELALGHLLAGDTAEALRVATRLWEDNPDMKRNALVLAGLLAASGDGDGARRHVAALKAGTPGLTLDTARLPSFGDRSAGERFRALLRDSGL